LVPSKLTCLAFTPLSPPLPPLSRFEEAFERVSLAARVFNQFVARLDSVHAPGRLIVFQKF
jgi:hypothetical protein